MKKRVFILVSLILFISLSFISAEEEIICIDSDGGRNPLIKGFVHVSQTLFNGTIAETTKTDECISVDNLRDDYPDLVDENGQISGVKEYSCYSLSDATIDISRYICPPGGCRDGACVNNWENNCVDTDGGTDLFVKGYTTSIQRPTDERIVITDSCMIIESGRYKEVDSCEPDERCLIREFICSDLSMTAYGVDLPPFYNYSRSLETIYGCPNGCKDGTCLPEDKSKWPKCTDSDGGLNYHERGNIRGKRENFEFIDIAADKCLDNTTLLEFYCREDNVLDAEFYYSCHQCSHGVCVEEGISIGVIDEPIPVDMPENEDKTIYACNGCSKDGKCYPIRYRTKERYCSINEYFEELSEGSCREDYECKSNECTSSGYCKLSKGLFAKIKYWFKNFFS